MAITLSTNLSNLTYQEINGLVSEIFMEGAYERVNTDTIYKIFDVVDDANGAYNNQLIASAIKMRKNGEGADVQKDSFQQGYKKTVRQEQVTGAFEVTKEMRLFQKVGILKDMMSETVDAAFDAIDQSGAEVLNNGWLTSYSDIYSQTVDATLADGLSLFSDSHRIEAGGATFGNIIYAGGATGSGVVNPALTSDSVIAGRIMAQTQRDTVGKLISMEADTLTVSAKDADLAFRIANSEFYPDNNRQTNSLKGRLNIVVWNRLTPGAWFIGDSKRMAKTLRMGFAQKPMLMPEVEIPSNYNWLYKLDYLNYIARNNPRFLFGSKGTNLA
jgi:hypothetical protein